MLLLVVLEVLLTLARWSRFALVTYASKLVLLRADEADGEEEAEEATDAPAATDGDMAARAVLVAGGRAGRAVPLARALVLRSSSSRAHTSEWSDEQRAREKSRERSRSGYEESA